MHIQNFVAHFALSLLTDFVRVHIALHTHHIYTVMWICIVLVFAHIVRYTRYTLRLMSAPIQLEICMEGERDRQTKKNKEKLEVICHGPWWLMVTVLAMEWKKENWKLRLPTRIYLAINIYLVKSVSSFDWSLLSFVAVKLSRQCECASSPTFECSCSFLYLCKLIEARTRKCFPFRILFDCIAMHPAHIRR